MDDALKNCTPGKWKPKRVNLHDHNYFYSIWSQEGELSLDVSRNKPPVLLCQNMYWPIKDPYGDSEYPKTQEQLEANIVMMAAAKDLLDALLEARSYIRETDYSEHLLVMDNINNAIKLATEVRFR